MKYLYHGTFDDNYEEILKNGVIMCDIGASMATQDINNLLGDSFRDGCTFLSSCPESTEAYAYAFKVPVSKLNTSLLYVADFNSADKLFSYVYGGRNNLDIEEIKGRYTNSFVSYSEYIDTKDTYDKLYFAEFLYFENIPVTEKDVLGNY